MPLKQLQLLQKILIFIELFNSSKKINYQLFILNDSNIFLTLYILFPIFL